MMSTVATELCIQEPQQQLRNNPSCISVPQLSLGLSRTRLPSSYSERCHLGNIMFGILETWQDIQRSQRQHPRAAAYCCKSHQCRSTHQGQGEWEDTKQLQATTLGLEAHPLLQSFCCLRIPLSWCFVYVISFCLSTKLTRCPVHM